MDEVSTASGISESLLRLQRIIAKARWGLFVLALVAAVYLRQFGFADNSTVVGLFALAGLAGLSSAIDEYLLRQARRRPRLALYGIALGDWVVATLVWVLAPAVAIEYPFIYFLPIIVGSVGLGVPGGILLGLLSTIALALQTWYVLGAKSVVQITPWVAAFLISGGVVGHVGQQWEMAQRHVEATYRWMAELSAATTVAEVVEVILRYLQNVVQIKGGSGTLAASGNGSAVALLMADEDEGRVSAYAAKGISPEARARLRVSTGDGFVSWSAREGRPVWVRLDEGAGLLPLPHVEELAHFRSCLVAPITSEGRMLALGLGFSRKLVGQNETEVRDTGLFSRQAAASLGKAIVYSRMERQFSTLASVLEKTRYSGHNDVKEVFQWVVAKAHELVAAETVALAIRDRADNLVVASTSGEGAEHMISRGDPSKTSPSDWVISRKSPLIVTDYPSDPRFSAREEDYEAFRSAVLVPLRIQDEVFGVLAAGSVERSRFSQNDLMVFIMLGQQVSVVLREARLRVEAQELGHILREQTEGGRVSEAQTGPSVAESASLQTEVEAMMAKLRSLWESGEPLTKQAPDREELYKGQMLIFAEELYKLYGLVRGQAKEISETKQELEQAQHSAALALVTGLERNYKFLAGSGERVGQLAVAIGHKLGYSPEEKKDIYFAGLLRDVGLIGVPPEVFLLPNLDESQMDLVRQHPIIGHAILTSFPFLASAAILVRYHHERWDGRGYPDALAGEAIPLGSRILAIADVYEALTADRSYRGPLSPPEAVDIILKNAGSQFDDKVCGAFVAVFEERRDIASWVLPKLSER